MSFWEDVARAVKSGDVSGEDAKIGLATLGLMHEVLNPGQRAPSPVDKMVDDVLKALLGEQPSGSLEDSSNKVAAFVKGVIAVNPILQRFGTELAKAWGQAETKRAAAGREAIGAGQVDYKPVGVNKAPGALSPLAARLAQMKK